MQRKTETDGEKGSWIGLLEQARPDEDGDIVAMYNTNKHIGCAYTSPYKKQSNGTVQKSKPRLILDT